MRTSSHSFRYMAYVHCIQCAKAMVRCQGANQINLPLASRHPTWGLSRKRDWPYSPQTSSDPLLIHKKENQGVGKNKLSEQGEKGSKSKSTGRKPKNKQHMCYHKTLLRVFTSRIVSWNTHKQKLDTLKKYTSGHYVLMPRNTKHRLQKGVDKSQSLERSRPLSFKPYQNNTLLQLSKTTDTRQHKAAGKNFSVSAISDRVH